MFIFSGQANLIMKTIQTLLKTLLLGVPAPVSITWAAVTLGVKPEPFEKELPSLQMSLGLPIQQDAPGRWLLRSVVETY
jgi:hypothetical protein